MRARFIRAPLLVLGLLAMGQLAVAPAPAAAQAKKKGKKKSSGKPKKTADLGKLAEAQVNPDEQQLQQAIQHFKEERYGLAAVSLYDLSSKKGIDGATKEAARYNLAKALFRLGLNHSSLTYFSELMASGPQSKYYRSSLEWSLFVARKIVADDQVLELVAKYSDGQFPQDYKNEFKYLLARHHYLKGNAIESGAEIGSLGETKVEETVTGGKSLKGDIFDDSAEVPEDDEEVELKRSKKGGFSLDEDIFSDEPEKPKEEEKKPEEVVPEKKDGELTAKEHYELATRYTLQVEQSSPFAAKAKFLEGVLMFREGKDNESLSAFKAVIRMTKEGASHEDKKLRQLAFFQLARTHFGAKQPSFAIFYYDKIERFTYAWLEALYEASWAEFRLGSYEKALGNLLTLHSPFFQDQYFPESHILKAVVYYENCRYPEANKILQEFKSRYEPVLGQLQELTKSTASTGKYYEILQNIRSDDIAKEGGADRAKILSQILTIALSDRELKNLDRSYKEVETELKSLDGQGEVFARSSLREVLERRIGEVLGEIEKEASRAVKRKLDREQRLIKTLLTQAIRIEIETARAEQERIESKLRDVQSAPAERTHQFVDWTDDEKLVWPFEDEYWRDELGTYQLTLAHTCR